MKPLMKTVKKVFLVHGEPVPQQVLANVIRNTYNVEVLNPGRGESFDLV